MKFLFKKIIKQSERDTGYPADYLREVLAASSMGFFKALLAMNLSRHQKHADHTLHRYAQLGSTLQESCGPCLEISKKYAKNAGISAQHIEAAIHDPELLPPVERAAFLLGRCTAGGDPLDPGLAEQLKNSVGQNGYAELVVSAAAVRIFPALKRGLGYADMCALPEPEQTHVASSSQTI